MDDAALQRLYGDFAAANLKPLWTEIGNLMPECPEPEARPCRWAWAELLPLAEWAGELVPVGRGGERRAITLANPGLHGRPYATPTLWAAVRIDGDQAIELRHADVGELLRQDGWPDRAAAAAGARHPLGGGGSA